MTVTKTWPGGNTNVTPTSYNIPEAGELNWAALTDFLSTLADGAQATTFQKFAIRQAITSPVTVSTNDCIVSIKLAAPAAVAVSLPAGVTKQVFVISDESGDANSNNITITPDGSDTIEGAGSLVLNSIHESVMLVFESASTDWKVVQNAKPNPNGTDIGGFTIDRAVVSDGSGDLSSSSTTSTEIGYVGGVTSAIQTQIDNKQPLDSDLTAISALATNGILSRTGSATYATRTDTSPNNLLTITNGDGVSGNPTFTVNEGNFNFSNISGSINLTSQVTGTLPLGSGGTGQTTAIAAFDGLAPTTAKGDLVVFDGTNNVAIPAGTDGQVLTADSGEVSGLNYTSP